MKTILFNILVIILLPITVPILLIHPASRKRIWEEAIDDIDWDNIKYIDGKDYKL